MAESLSLGPRGREISLPLELREKEISLSGAETESEREISLSGPLRSGFLEFWERKISPSGPGTQRFLFLGLWERKRQTSPLEAFASRRGERGGRKRERERETALRPLESLILKASGTHRP